jgi:hypothetical protein
MSASKDARINTALPSHPKTKKLLRELGAQGGWYLVRLFLWVTENRSDGDLSGMSDDDIELAIDWPGGVGEFVTQLVAVGFIDNEAECRRIHDWNEHNPWAAGAKDRSTKARWNAAKRHHGEAAADRLVPEHRASSTANSNAGSTAPALQLVASSSAPYPYPYPSPIQEQKNEPNGSSASAGAEAPPKRSTAIPYEEIAAEYNATMTGLAKLRDMTPARRTLIRSRWKAAPQRQSLAFWQAYFTQCHADAFLNGTGPYKPPHENWRPTFDHLMADKTVTQVFERAMDRMERTA